MTTASDKKEQALRRVTKKQPTNPTPREYSDLEYSEQPEGKFTTGQIQAVYNASQYATDWD